MTHSTTGDEHVTGDHEALLDYLYDEGEPEQRRRIERHLAECVTCADVAGDLQSVRGRLSAWIPPTTRLGFKIVQDAPAAPTANVPPLRGGWYPPVSRWSGWAQMAAALLLFTSGMAVSQLNVQYRDGGVTVSVREPGIADREPARDFALTPAEPAATPGSPAVSSPEDTLRRDLALVDRPRSTPTAVDSDAVLRRVQAMIERSEQRQQQELALRLAQVVRDYDTQRRADLLRVEQNFGQLEGQTGAAIAQQREELLDYLVRVSQTPGR